MLEDENEDDVDEFFDDDNLDEMASIQEEDDELDISKSMFSHQRSPLLTANVKNNVHIKQVNKSEINETLLKIYEKFPLIILGYFNNVYSFIYFKNNDEYINKKPSCTFLSFKMTFNKVNINDSYLYGKIEFFDKTIIKSNKESNFSNSDCFIESKDILSLVDKKEFIDKENVILYFGILLAGKDSYVISDFDKIIIETYLQFNVTNYNNYDNFVNRKKIDLTLFKLKKIEYTPNLIILTKESYENLYSKK